ncbi:MAG: NAD(P)H-dependent glycerol-3-phosphate dehydrogenase [Thermaurantiacus sp.]
MSSPAIAVIGAGAFGTALAALVASDASPVRLWARRPEAAARIARTRENEAHLPGVRLPGEVAVTSDLAAAASAPLWILAIPAQHLRSVLAEAPLERRPTLLITAKGLEAGTRNLMTEVAAEVAPHCPAAILSGPSFAADIARGLPTAVTLAASDLAVAQSLARTLARPHFRPYASADPVGAQVGGLTKNVLAIACGVVVGAGLGESARAALVARGFAEMTRLGLALGAQAETMAGLSGLGDLVLTCGSTRSRNMALGVALGQGQTPAEARAGRTDVAEGAATAPALVALARRLGIDMPVAAAVADLLAGRATLAESIAGLLARPLRNEAETRHTVAEVQRG